MCNEGREKIDILVWSVLWFLNRSRLLEEGKLKRARFDIFVDSEGGLISGCLTSSGFCPNLVKKYIYIRSLNATYSKVKEI